MRRRIVFVLSSVIPLLALAVLLYQSYSPMAVPTPSGPKPERQEAKEQPLLTPEPSVVSERQRHASKGAEKPAVPEWRSFQLAAQVVFQGKPVEGARVYAKVLEESPAPNRLFTSIMRQPASDTYGHVKTAPVRYRSDMPDASLVGVASYHPEYGSGYAEYTLGELLTVGGSDVILELEPGHVVMGRVVDAEGVPVVRARVGLYTRYPNDQVVLSGLDVMTDEDGNFFMAGVRFENTPSNILVKHRSAPAPGEHIGSSVSKKRIVRARDFDEETQTWNIGQITLPAVITSPGITTASEAFTRPVRR